jgi:LacI family repressor for deo operon, udp, cdd, tsx, nupC, and nupG
MAVTLKQVAEHAGVTQQTVSRAFQAPQRVKEATRQRIHALARDMGYRPNAAARSLRIGGRAGVGLMMGTPLQTRATVMLRSYVDLLNQLCSHCEQQDLNLLLGLMHEAITPGHDLDSLPRVIEQAHVGPVVVLGHMWDELAATLRTWKIPAIVIDGPACGLPAIQIDEPLSIQVLVDHFVELGHQRIAFINHSDARGINCTGGYRDTLWPQGYLEAMAKHGLPPYPGWDHYYDGEDFEKIMDRYFTKANSPTAMITYDDQQLLWLIEVLRKRQLRVPEDVSLAAATDIGFTEATLTPITRMVRPNKAMAKLAVQWINENLTDYEPAKSAIKRLPAELTVGTTSAAPDPFV